MTRSSLASILFGCWLTASVIGNGARAQVPERGADEPLPAPRPAAPASGPVGSPSEKLRWLAQQIEQALADPALKGAEVGVAVSEVDTGKLVFGKNEGALLNPASNAKLVTTAAALAMLGPEYRWKTVVYADGPVQGGELKGRLYLKGHGDPTLVVEDLWRIVSDLWSMGVRKIGGDLAVDDTFFDGDRLAPAFDQKQEDAPFRAPSGALSLNYNAVGVRVLPGPADGAPARVVLDPQTPYLVVINEARTVQGARTQLIIEAKEREATTEITVKGRIRVGDRGQLAQRRIGHPDLYAAHAFRELCARRGIKLSGQVVRASAPPGARALSSHYSQPLGVAVRDVNKRSNNFMAEQILKTLGAETGGRPGTWQKGLEAVAGFLERLGIPRAEYKMTNGSGLYDANRFTPSQLVKLLGGAYKDFRFASDFVGSLALAGADGTVGHRMEGGPAERMVRAKTGTLLGVSCLSGYAGATGRLPLAFAVMMNNLSEAGAAAARRVQDQIAESLVLYLSSR